MIVPVEEAPPEFMRRYHAVMRGDEQLDTIGKLKNFWLFGINQGWPHPEMREYIALLTEEVDWKSPISSKLLGDHWEYDRGQPTVWIIHDAFRSFKGMLPTPYPKELSDEQYVNERWEMIEELINDFKPEQYKNLDV